MRRQDGTRLLAILLVTCAAGVAVAADRPEGQWKSLLDGKSIKGWQQHGGKAKYRVEDGAIAGRSVANTSNSRITLIQNTGPDGPVWKLIARGMADGRPMWSHTLAGEPVRWGIAIDAGKRIIVTLRGGRVLCFGYEK